MDLLIRLLDHRASKKTLLAKTKAQVSASLIFVMVFAMSKVNNLDVLLIVIVTE